MRSNLGLPPAPSSTISYLTLSMSQSTASREAFMIGLMLFIWVSAVRQPCR